MRKLHRDLVNTAVAVSLVVLTGCAVGPRYAPQTFTADLPKPGRALVYLYRPSQRPGNDPPVEFYLDERSVGRLDAEQYIVVDIEPGQHRIMGHVRDGWSDYWLPPGGFAASPGVSYFVYPITRFTKENIPLWKPLAVAAGTAIISGGTLFFIPLGREAEVAAGHYWQLADENTPDAYVDRMKTHAQRVTSASKR